MSRQAPRARLSPAARKAQLVAAAADLFERIGYDQVSIEQIAARAGVSPALVHHYFGSKRGAMLGVVDEAIARFTAAVAPPEAGPDDPADRWIRLEATLERYLEFILLYPRGYAYATGAHGAPDHEVRRRMAEAREHTLQLLLAQLELNDPTPEDALRVWGWIGFVHTTVVRWIDRPEIDRRALVTLLSDSARLLIEPQRRHS